MRRNLLTGKLVRAHLRAEIGPIHLTTLEISMESYLLWCNTRFDQEKTASPARLY